MIWRQFLCLCLKLPSSKKDVILNMIKHNIRTRKFKNVGKGHNQEVELTGASKVRDLMERGCLTARARAKMQPKEWATMWKDLTLLGSSTDLSIISKCSLRVYMESVGFGLLPNPNRSIAKSLKLDFAALEKFGNNVSVQNADDEINPCMKSTFSCAL